MLSSALPHPGASPSCLAYINTSIIRSPRNRTFKITEIRTVMVKVTTLSLLSSPAAQVLRVASGVSHYLGILVD